MKMRNNKTHAMARLLWAAMAALALALLARTGMAQPAERAFKGKVVDDKGNGVAGVRVALTRLGVAAETGEDGSFSLPLGGSPLSPGDDGTVEILDLSKDRLRERMIRITDASYFDKPAEEKMEPSPVGADTLGFAALMPSSGSFIEQIARNKPDPPCAITADQLREVLEGVAEKSRHAVPDGEVNFYAWAPEGVKKLRAVFLISLHGIGTIDDPILRRFAQRHDTALVGVIGDPIQRGCYPLELMDKHLERLGEMLGHPELATAPVLTFGHSNGTGFATVYASDRADRLIGWVSYHSGFAWQLLMPGVEKAPGLVMHGQLDTYVLNGQDQAVKDLRSQRHAPVGMMMEGNVEHQPVDRPATWEFVVAFCEAAMRIRLDGDGHLRPVNLEQGWLGGIYDRDASGQQLLPIAPFNTFEGDRTTANWLPDEEFAKIWQAYGEKDPRPRAEEQK